MAATSRLLKPRHCGLGLGASSRVSMVVGSWRGVVSGRRQSTKASLTSSRPFSTRLPATSFAAFRSRVLAGFLLCRFISSLKVEVLRKRRPERRASENPRESNQRTPKAPFKRYSLWVYEPGHGRRRGAVCAFSDSPTVGPGRNIGRDQAKLTLSLIVCPLITPPPRPVCIPSGVALSQPVCSSLNA